MRKRATPGLIRATKTAVFQIHAPSARKRAALLDAMKRTHLATEAVLAALLREFGTIRDLAKKRQRDDFMQPIAYGTLRTWDLSGASLIAARTDAIGMVESYLQQLGDGRETASPPALMPMEGRAILRFAALDELANTHADRERENELRDEISRMTRPAGPRPLSLHGYERYFQLLRHPVTERLYVWVNLLPQSSRFAPSQREANERARNIAREMFDFTTGEIVRCKRPTWMLFPLEHGFSFHERRFLLTGEPGGGRIVYRPESDRFEIHVSFTYESEPIETERRFIGIDRGIYNLAAWAVVDEDGRLVADGEISGMGLRHAQREIERRTREAQRRRGHVSIRVKRAQADEAVHVAANAIVAVAKSHAARVAIEELTIQRRLRALPKGKKGGAFGRMARRILGRQQYAKLVHALTYKLAKEGLPGPVAIGAAGTSQTCPECCCVAAENRRKVRREGEDMIDMAQFRCIKCGHEANADRNAARVIGIKAAWLTQLPSRASRAGRPLRDDEKFAHYLASAAMRRGPSAGKPVVPS